MKIEYLLIMLGGVVLSSFSQILLKKGAMKYAAQGAQAGWLRQYLNPYVLSGYFLLGVSMLIPLYVYRYMALKYGAVIESLAYAVIMALSALFLGEQITRRKVFGNVLIILGVIIFTLGSG